LAFCREKLKVAHTINALTENVTEKLKDITDGDMPSVIIDATGNLRAINTAFTYLAHGGRYVLIGLQKGEISFSHPEFHKREATLMSSRNATRADFEHVISSMKSGEIDPTTYITNRVAFGQVKDEFAGWLDPANGVIKAMVSLGE
jgi:threonine dehydrogenase-like Zn-dependent dehydrogenase